MAKKDEGVDPNRGNNTNHPGTGGSKGQGSGGGTSPGKSKNTNKPGGNSTKPDTK